MGGERTETLPASATDCFQDFTVNPALLYFAQVSNLGIQKKKKKSSEFLK